MIVAGDVGETEAHLRFAWRLLEQRFARLFWVPGNHELWTLPRDPVQLRGEERYLRLVEICREHGVVTPEDPYVEWPGEIREGEPEPLEATAPLDETAEQPLPPPVCRIAPLFLLYDYSFAPDGVPPERAVAWAAEEEIMATDELLLHPDPYPSRPAWCHARCEEAEGRLAEASAEASLVLVNHWPLRRDTAELPRIPRFTIWCGTRRTEDWHRRFRALAVVHGHLHIRRTRLRDGVPFHEVSLGYPQQWEPERGLESSLTQVLPLASEKA